MNPIDTRAALAGLFRQAALTAFPDLASIQIEVERPKNPEHGDYAVTSALQLAKRLGKKPRDIAEAIVKALPENQLVAGVPQIAGPGFINIRLSQAAGLNVVARILGQKEAFGRGAGGKGRKIIVEFVSANPTGPLHVGHARGAAVGDSIARLLEWQGWDVLREFYYNDSGNQIHTLMLSTRARIAEINGVAFDMPADAYNGEYIKDIARDYLAAHPEDRNGANTEAVRKFAVAYLRNEQDLDLKAFDVRFDVYFLESSLYTDGLVEKTVNHLVKMGHTYEQDGALWLKSTEYGDDKDRVMRKSDGTYTYFAPDVAYHVTKWERGFTRAITELGADHHGSLARVRAGLQAMEIGVPVGYPDYVLHQMISVMRGGEEVKISKRAGSYVTLRDLIDEVGRDATRYFFVMRKSDSQLTFDIDLAKSRSEDNPVYYVQYAHARICSVLGLWGGDLAALSDVDLLPLVSKYESDLLRTLADFPELLATAARELSPHLVCVYLADLAAKLHSYYNAEKFLVDDEKLKLARLALIMATRQVLKNGLAVLGVGAPEKM